MMKKISILAGIMALAAIIPARVSAQQTLEEATDSIKKIMSDAKAGNAVAQNEVGGWYYRGRHVNQNYEEALQWWSKSAKQGNVLAIGNMGLCYQTGHGIKADSLKAVQLYQKSIKEGNAALLNQNIEKAREGNVFSCMLVASCYQNGIGVQKDTQKAVPFLTTAAEKNCVMAQRDLGMALLNGKKAKEAAPWFKKGSENGDLTSTFYYGKMLLEGLGVKEDKKEGANFMLKAAENGFPQAMYYLGNCYMKGDGLTKNSEQALKWYKLAAGKRVTGAEWDLAQCLREGKGCEKNYEQALYWYAEAVNGGYAKAFHDLITDSIPDSPFVAYLKGWKEYQEGKYDEALKDFKIVEKAKISDGKVMEGAIYANSNYAKYNVKKGVKLLTEAAEKNNNAQALYLLGALYEAGKGVEKNMPVAVADMTKAAKAGYAPAQCSLADMYYEGRGVNQNYEKAVEWYAKAFEQGQINENAAKRYASCYEEGKGVAEPDKQMAEQIMKGYQKSKIAELLQKI